MNTKSILNQDTVLPTFRTKEEIRAEQAKLNEQWSSFHNSPELYEYLTGKKAPATLSSDFDDEFPY